MENSFAFWQELDEDTWVETLRDRLGQLTTEERSASFAYLFSPLDWRVRLSQCQGPLARVPFMLKDLFDVEGYETYASSQFLANIRGKATHTARFVQLLQSLGAILVGKSHLNEFAYGLSGENPHYGDCPHPFLKNRLSGGSSSGSAFLVGRDIVPLSVGTDTGGSVRVPASYCGLYGFRSVPGLWMEGCFPLAERFDTVGCFTREEEDLKTLLSALTFPREPAVSGGLLLLPPGFPWIDSFLEKLSDYSYNEDLSRSFFENSLDRVKAFTILQSREAYAYHRPWLKQFGKQYDPKVLQRIEAGQHWSKEEVTWAEHICEETVKQLNALLEEHGSIVLPGAPSGAPLPKDLSDEFRKSTLALTVPASLAGLPVISRPLLEDPISVGIQKIVPVGEIPEPTEDSNV